MLLRIDESRAAPIRRSDTLPTGLVVKKKATTIINTDVADKRMSTLKVLNLIKNVVSRLTYSLKTDPRLHSYCSNVSKIDGVLAHIGIDYDTCGITFGFAIEYYDHFMMYECSQYGFERSLSRSSFRRRQSSTANSNSLMYVNLFGINDKGGLRRLPYLIRRTVKWLMRPKDRPCTTYTLYY